MQLAKVHEFLSSSTQNPHNFFSEPTVPALQSKDSRKPKHILYWNEAYGSTKYGFCCGRDPFVSFGCPVSDCSATDVRNGSGSNPEDFDAVVFHQRSLMASDLPAERSQKQRYVMFMIESPAYPFGFKG